MANNANKQSEDKKKAPLTVENAVVSDAAKPSKPILLWVAILTLLVIGAGLYWLIEQQKNVISSMAERVDASEQQLSGQLSELNKTLTTGSASTTQLLENLNSTDVGLAAKITEIVEIQDMTNDDVKRVWAMAEVEFLLQTASQRVLLAGDSEGARMALSLADEKLKALADPRLYRLRALLSDEQLALASVAKVDIDGLAVRLQSIINQIDNLQVLMAPSIAMTEAESKAEAASVLPGDWKAALAAAWDSVRSLVTIRHQEDGAAAVLVPEEHFFLYQNLHLKLETARTALLAGREVIYHDSLASAEQWLIQYFIGEERDAVLASVKAVNAENITVTMPDISGSLAWLQDKGDQ
jgi:uroporphyrin-3 C-methyltransferase